MEKYSVLMTVYNGEKAEYFEEAVRSIFEQTIPSDDVVVVCDGELNPELNSIIYQTECEHPNVFQVFRLEENVGIGAAANYGIRKCKNNLVARMDSDDLAVPNRCEKQLQRFSEDSNLVVLGGYIEEFSINPDNVFAVRVVPTEYDEIRRFARRRQPFNNTTVMFKKDAVLAVGGYRSLRRAEDYDLYIRLLHNGYYAENIPEILTKVRVNQGAQKRRASIDTLCGCIMSRWAAYKLGYSNFLDFLFCSVGGIVIFVCPEFVQGWLYSKFLRDEPKIKQQTEYSVLNK